MKKINESDARRMFTRQRAAASKRGIGWEFTFDQWLLWWGDDLALRGPGHAQLQMQRITDTGPYRPDNVKKGRPADNRRTHKIQIRNAKVLAAGEAHQRALDRAPMGEQDESPDDDGAHELAYFTMYQRIDRDAVRSCDWEDAPLKPSVGWYDE